jgi:uncharacterized membrane protein
MKNPLPILPTLLQWLVVLLILRVLISILANYPDYFPPRFDSLFLEGREKTFRGVYRIAFYVHIVMAPFVLVNGLIILSERIRRRSRNWHRRLGWTQVAVLLIFVLPSSVVMSRHSFGGWPAGLSFLLLSVTTGWCAILGVVHARNRHYERHREWMIRSYVLISSAVILRLISGATSLIGVENPEFAYIAASWSSWLIPLTVYEWMRVYLLNR